MVAFATIVMGDAPWPSKTDPVATVDVPMPPADTLRTPPNDIVPFVVIGLFEIVNPVAPPLRPTLVTVPTKAGDWNVAAKLVPFAVRT